MGIICPLVEIGLTDLPKLEGAMSPPAPLFPTGLQTGGPSVAVGFQASTNPEQVALSGNYL